MTPLDPSTERTTAGRALLPPRCLGRSSEELDVRETCALQTSGCEQALSLSRNYPLSRQVFGGRGRRHTSSELLLLRSDILMLPHLTEL